MDQILSQLSQYGQFIQLNVGIVIGTIVVVALVIGSGSFAASIAESRHRGPILHFLAGCIIPVVYPGLIFFTMSVATGPGKREKKKEKGERIMRMEGAPPPEAPPVIDGEEGPPVIDEDSLGEAVIKFDQTYFKQKIYDERGNYRGPFVFVVNGEKFKVERIIETLDSVVIIENVSSDGKTQHLRIPYSHVESCTEIE